MEQVLFTMNGNGILGYWSRKTSHYSSRHRNDNAKSLDEKVLVVYLGEESRGHGFIIIIQCS